MKRVVHQRIGKLDDLGWEIEMRYWMWAALLSTTLAVHGEANAKKHSNQPSSSHHSSHSSAPKQAALAPQPQDQATPSEQHPTTPDHPAQAATPQSHAQTTPQPAEATAPPQAQATPQQEVSSATAAPAAAEAQAAREAPVVSRVAQADDDEVPGRPRRRK
jgi:hypothetical protein